MRGLVLSQLESWHSPSLRVELRNVFTQSLKHCSTISLYVLRERRDDESSQERGRVRTSTTLESVDYGAGTADTDEPQE